MNKLTTVERRGEYLSVADVAAELACSEPTVRRRIRDGSLPAVKLGARTQQRPPHPARRPPELAVGRSRRGGLRMPRATKRKIDPDAVYEAWTSIALHEPNVVIATGTRMRGSDAAVQAAPWAFVTAGTPQHEWPSQLGTTEAPKPKPGPKCDVRLQVEPRPLDGVVELTRPVKVLIESGAVNLSGGLPGRLLVFEKGVRFKVDAELVGRLPDDAVKEI